MREKNVSFLFFCFYLFIYCEQQITKMSAVCVTVQMDNPEMGEEWRSYILTVIKVSKHTHISLKTHTDGLMSNRLSVQMLLMVQNMAECS